MNNPNQTFDAVLEYLGEPLTTEEFAVLGLPESTMQRLAQLLRAEAEGALSLTQAAELEAFKEAAFYMRMGNRTE